MHSDKKEVASSLMGFNSKIDMVHYTRIYGLKTSAHSVSIKTTYE